MIRLHGCAGWSWSTLAEKGNTTAASKLKSKALHVKVSLEKER